MSTSGYIRFPVVSNPSTLAQQAYDYIKARSPQWLENDASLDTWIIQAFSTLASDLTELVSDVPDDIFRFFGTTLLAFPPQDSTQSTVFTTWTVIDNLGYTIPAGTQVSIRDSAGNQYAFETLVDIVIPAGNLSTAVGEVELRSVETGADTAGLGGNGVQAQLLDTLAYVSAITMTDVTTGGLDAEDDDTYLNRLAKFLRLLSTRPVLPRDFAILARNVSGVYRAVAIDGYNPLHNLLTANEASAETDASGWINGGNATVASTAAQAADGAKSVSMTAIAAGNMAIVESSSKTVSPGDTITALASVRANTTARQVQVSIQWRDAADAVINQVDGALSNDSNAAWTPYSVTAIAPATAVKARVFVRVVGAALGEVHYVDKMSMRRGSGVDWVAGGTGETGQQRTITLAAIDVNGADVSGTVQTEIRDLMTANREINFLVYVVGAKRSPIDVNFVAKAATGYDPADVEARAEAAVAAFLDAAVWGNTTNDPQDWVEQTVVRYSEIAQVVSNVEGLDYWTTLTIGYSGGALAVGDVTIAGPAALAVAGNITGNVT